MSSDDPNNSLDPNAVITQSSPTEEVLTSDLQSTPPVEVTSAEAWQILTDVDFENALLDYGRRKRFMLGLFLLCSSPGILNGFHMVVYVFYEHTPRHWCSVPLLENANWTTEQIRSISSPNPKEWSNCEYYDEDYEQLRRMGYEKAFRKVRKGKRPGTRRCERFRYDTKPGTSIVPEWDLVCDRLALRATVQTAVSLGKLLGAFVFGLVDDKYGRKVSFTVSSFMYIVAGPLVALTSLYHVMLIARIFLGIASLGIYQSAYSILTEACPSDLRPILGSMYNQSYPLGIIGVAIIGYYVRDWKTLQFCISLPAFLLIIHIWFLPESPRWLYYSGRKKYAWMAVGKLSPANERVLAEFRRRLVICWTIWCSVALCYYSLSIGANNLHLNPYIYVGLSGVIECISYVLALPILRIFGRRSASWTLLLIGSAAFCFLLVTPVERIIYRMAAALLGRLCVSSVFVVVTIHVCELFPTVVRNSAIGSSSTWAHVGSIFSPYLVDFFVIYGDWLPSAVCGLVLFLAAILAQALPETRGLPLYNTLQDFVARCEDNPKERVSLLNCLILYPCKKCLGDRNHQERPATENGHPLYTRPPN